MGIITACIKRTDIISCIQSYLALASLVIYASGFALVDEKVQFVGVFGFFVANVIFGCLAIADRVMFLMLHAGLFLFLLTRPLVATFDSSRSWNMSSYETAVMALFSIMLTMLCLRIGAIGANLIKGRRHLSIKRSHDESCEASAVKFHFGIGWLGSEEGKRCIRYAALFLYMGCFAVSMLIGYQRLNYMSGRAYEEYYMATRDDYSSPLLGNFEVMLPFALCAYLATQPSKRGSTIALVLFIVTTLPLLIIGARTDFVMAVLFFGVYYLLRNSVPEEHGVWIGPFEKTLVCIGLPLGIAAMGAVNYLRANQSASGDFLWLLGDTLYKQGVTFKVLGLGFDWYPQIHELGFMGFTFYPIIHNFTQGFIGQVFLHMPLLPEVNSVELALYGSSYGNTISYFAHPNYLGGEGYGSCYLLELYTDFGFAGIAVFSVLLGFLSVHICRLVGKNWFGGMLALLAIYNVFHIARGTVLEWCGFLFKTRFWAFLVLLIAGAFLLLIIMHKKHTVCPKRVSLGCLLLEPLGEMDVTKNRCGLTVLQMNGRNGISRLGKRDCND